MSNKREGKGGGTELQEAKAWGRRWVIRNPHSIKVSYCFTVVKGFMILLFPSPNGIAN